jgi:hypothetical protein
VTLFHFIQNLTSDLYALSEKKEKPETKKAEKTAAPVEKEAEKKSRRFSHHNMTGKILSSRSEKRLSSLSPHSDAVVPPEWIVESADGTVLQIQENEEEAVAVKGFSASKSQPKSRKVEKGAKKERKEKKSGKDRPKSRKEKRSMDVRRSTDTDSRKDRKSLKEKAPSSLTSNEEYLHTEDDGDNLDYGDGDESDVKSAAMHPALAPSLPPLHLHSQPSDPSYDFDTAELEKLVQNDMSGLDVLDGLAGQHTAAPDDLTNALNVLEQFM